MGSFIGSIVLRSGRSDTARAAEFWSGALGCYAAKPGQPQDSWLRRAGPRRQPPARTTEPRTYISMRPMECTSTSR